MGKKKGEENKEEPGLDQPISSHMDAELIFCFWKGLVVISAMAVHFSQKVALWLQEEVVE